MAMATIHFPFGAVAALVTTFFALTTIAAINYFSPEEKFYLTQIFVMAMLARIAFGMLLEVGDMRSFFAGDSLTYDAFGFRLTELWSSRGDANELLTVKARTMTSGWGMNYLVGILYLFTGRNIYAAQSMCAVIGAATVPLIYNCSTQIFNNRRVGKAAALLVAFYPAFVIWSGQLLKDGIIVFLLVLCITLVTNLQKKFSYFSISILVFSLMGIASLRFYIFYMVAAAVVGTFVIGFSNSPAAIVRRLAVMIIIGMSLTYIGVIKNAGDDINNFGNLEKLQSIRQDSVRSADSGYGKDLDVSTTEGAITSLPIGFAYLMFAPFPWEISNFRQLITLPEVLLWWSSIPLMLMGLFYTVKYRLRSALGILIFTLMLTLAYSLFQGNVGTAYRVRTQIQVFLFIFIAVGWTILKEKRDNKNLLLKVQKQRNLKRFMRAET